MAVVYGADALAKTPCRCRVTPVLRINRRHRGGRRRSTFINPLIRAVQGTSCSRPHFSPYGKQLMFLNTRSNRFLSRALVMAFAATCGVSVSSVAQAQMATGSGCTNCGGASSPVITYSSPATTQYSQPMTPQSYPASTTVMQSYPSSSRAGCASTRRRCSSPQRMVVHHRQPSNCCGTTYSNTPVYSGGNRYSGNGAYTTVNSYPMSGVSNNMMQVSTPVMQTGAGCPGGNCR